ncbi:type II toxin-antitoxin system RelE/ParE family toxin [Salinispirillum marinum]|uniref:Type II toxin-antitoxin system RelE/ParE family toxin n=2 Tax=Saccharospirillaceae TaxID=255527 RepID=A0ABV8BCZ1_9GAMM
MRHYKLSNEAKLDLARIYWRGVEAFGEHQAERYYEALFKRFDDIAKTPYKYPSVDHIRDGYRRSVCGVDHIYYRVIGERTDIMRILGRQDVAQRL